MNVGIQSPTIYSTASSALPLSLAATTAPSSHSRTHTNKCCSVNIRHGKSLTFRRVILCVVFCCVGISLVSMTQRIRLAQQALSVRNQTIINNNNNHSSIQAIVKQPDVRLVLDTVSDFITDRVRLREHFGLGVARDDELQRSDNHQTTTSSTRNTSELLIYFVTPTYYRSTQLADLTRLSQTLMHDKRVYWLLMEDTTTKCTVRLRSLLNRTGLPYAHVAVPTDPAVKKQWCVKGTAQRNVALDIVESIGLPGIVYFGDDDNSYDVRLFNQIRQTRRVGVSGVALSIGPYERCEVSKETGKVIGFHTMWDGKRTYAMDMAGFAFHSDLIKEKHPRFRTDWPTGFLETNFIKQLIARVEDLEPLDNCTKLYSWHVRSSAFGPNIEHPQTVGNDTDSDLIVPWV